jgi:hypothetical protein
VDPRSGEQPRVQAHRSHSEDWSEGADSEVRPGDTARAALLALEVGSRSSGAAASASEPLSIRGRRRTGETSAGQDRGCWGKGRDRSLGV